MTDSLAQPTIDPQDTTKQNILDLGSGVGLVAGSIASLISQNIAFAALPISLAVALQIANRRRLATEVISNNATAHGAIEQLAQHIQRSQGQVAEQFQQNQHHTAQEFNQHRQERQTGLNKLSEHIAQLREAIGELNQETTDITSFTQKLDTKQQELANTVHELRQIDNYSQGLQSSPNGVALFYQRGISHQKLGDYAEAIADFNEVLSRDLGHAQAYHQRGLIHAELGSRKLAVEDLRLAAKYYFEQGDLDNYQITRDLSKEYYNFRHGLEAEVIDSQAILADLPQEEDIAPGTIPIQVTESVSVGGLFS